MAKKRKKIDIEWPLIQPFKEFAREFGQEETLHLAETFEDGKGNLLDKAYQTALREKVKNYYNALAITSDAGLRVLCYEILKYFALIPETFILCGDKIRRAEEEVK